MYDSIKNFNKQFLYEPEIKNRENLAEKSSFIVVGMGGSALAPLLLKTWKLKLDILIHRDYGLPEIPMEELKDKLIILSSYSGNTEEVIDAFEKAKSGGLNMAVISTGGKLLYLAKDSNVPYIELPDNKVQPRLALGLSVKAFLKFMGEEDELKKLSALATTLNPGDYEKDGKILAEKLKNHIPVIYASNNNLSLIYNWKIKLNETGKIPAFYNVFPELNHNEMTGFSAGGGSAFGGDTNSDVINLCSKFHFIILKDAEDNPKIFRRMEVLGKLFEDRNFNVEKIELTGKDTWHKIFSSLVLADWVAYYTATGYGLEPEQVPMVEEFKKLINPSP